MIAEVARHRAELVRLCQRFDVVRLDLFGSAATGEFDDVRSDVDFLVELGDRPDPSRLDAYFGLKEALEELLSRRVDLVVAGALRNPYVAAAVERTREPLYAA